MPSLPRKARNGDDFKSYTTSAINKLIDYLHSMRPKDSSDIKVKESASGLMFELAKRPAKTPQVIGGGGGGGTFNGFFSADMTVSQFNPPYTTTTNGIFKLDYYISHTNSSGGPESFGGDISVRINKVGSSSYVEFPVISYVSENQLLNLASGISGCFTLPVANGNTISLVAHASGTTISTNTYFIHE